ncbi:tRNA pseudouridine(55) synthase TruB [Thiomicrospira sp. WB1]|uniref:tRNA pseudouridine(55) synthase TruB n=1 Tax=Thiomicrospira sp. WB1 TaxID=1685380 RepID=UPI00074A698D|nr:tRNA pseudouridine(55) synthase TruB [Thiomicrospira sp. WB1]KUJ71977.1 pseudouridine synthase [Thiomicrospira sp. WB1]
MSDKARRHVHGVVLVDKPAGMTSNAVLQQVKRLFSAKKGGHTGALDPFATGLLPICLGEATKFSGFLLNAQKGYIATLKLGQATDSGDCLGNPTDKAPVPALTTEKVVGALNTFLGTTLQTPPMYSALKHQGRPLYEYARQGIEIERQPREITLERLVLKDIEDDQIRFEVLCSKGTYVRTLGEDIARKLGTVGHLTALHRIQSGALTADEMHSLEEIERDPMATLLPMDTPLAHLQAMSLSAEEAELTLRGGKLAVPRPETDLVRFYEAQGQFIGVGEWQEAKSLLKPKRLVQMALLNADPGHDDAL